MLIQKERIVESKQLQNVQGQINAKKNTWMQWYAQVNAFHTKVSSKSFAEVLKHGKQILVDKTDHNSVWQVDKTDHNLVRQAVNKPPIAGFSYNSIPASGSKQKKAVSDLGSVKMQAYTLCLTNRFQKNKTGKKLGLNSTESFRADKGLEQKVHDTVLRQTQLIPTNIDIQVHTDTHWPKKRC